MKNFTFCILTFNHEEYIVEHLESIKFQIENYGKEISCALIINDDASKDGTVARIEAWLRVNGTIFSEVAKIYNSNNIGTCSGVVNISRLIKTEHCKITAGDDLYSHHNIFQFISTVSHYSMMMGIPIRLIDGVVKFSRFEIINILASDIIYKNSKLLHRLSNISLINAPNLIYKTEYLKTLKIQNFIKTFDVIEDWPLQVAIAENDSEAKIMSRNVPLVLYRRTQGSTYIVANRRFVDDQIRMLNYLINEYKFKKEYFQLLLLINRKYIILSKSYLIKNTLNLSRLIYAVRFLYNLPAIVRAYFVLKVETEEYQSYYDAIVRVSKPDSM